MLRVKGLYDGTKIILLEPVSLSPNTPVEVLIPEQEQDYWQALIKAGLIKEIRSPSSVDQAITPIQTTGRPISETIIAERR